MKRFLVGTVINCLGLWLVTLVIPAIKIAPWGGETTWNLVASFVFVGMIFGLVTAIVAPVIKVLAFPLYILTFGLISVLINGAMLRAAELAKEKGFFGFRVVKDSAGSESSAMSMGGSFNAYQVGNQTFGSMNSMPLILSRSQYSISIYFLNKGEFMPGDFESQQLISNLKSKF